jgi:NAD(P)-dependent dehydrogenase (short-subunit alcohol dehydrogenase family)
MLTGKVVMVVGAGGIGDELARRYAAEGASVVLGDLDADRAVRVAGEIVGAGGRAMGSALDGADDASIADALALTRATYGRLDGMHVNFARFAPDQSDVGLEFDIASHDEMVRVNIRGYLLCARHGVPAMIDGGGGSLVFTSSGAAHSQSGVRFSYGMCKAAIHSLMRNIAVRYGPQGVRANVIAPGLIAHPKMVANMPPGLETFVKTQAPIRSRFGRSADIAAMGAFLLSDDAGYVTGQVISVDGGLTMRL